MQKRALVVDDERSTCDLIEKVLSSVGIDSLCLTTSSEAPSVLRLGRFAVAFLDYHMAQPDGPELTRQMRDSVYNRLTPVILLSDDQRPNAVSNGFKAGASFFLYKPIDRDRLLRLVRATHGAIEQGQRRTRRVPLKSRVQLQFCGQEFEAETIDVSMEGLLIRTPRIIPLGSSVGVCLYLGKSMSPILGAGSVVRLPGKDQMGIHLGRLSIAESQRLQEFLLPLIPSQ
jgi:DNA-binding response OmpR family regulator